MPWTDAGAATDGQRIVDVGGERLLVVVQGDRAFASDGLCPHKFGPLQEGTFGPGCVTCPIHDATFDLATGRPGDGEGWAGTLPVCEARITAGRVEVLIP